MTFRVLTDQQKPFFAWRRHAPVQKILRALETAAPSGNRFVGGCVRDSFIGVAPKDIDLATILTPDQTTAALRAAGLSAAPTGVAHGTVTAIADHVPVEVTTLRADVTTDGRRATVAFTTDWATDAARRDFTINALYLTPDDQVYDCLGGLDDLAARRVRFIGAPEDRIREDYLRILRFFRFSARFAQNGFDADGLVACAVHADGIETLSAERIGQELSRLLDLDAPIGALRAMMRSGVLAKIWPAPPDIDVAAHLKVDDAGALTPLMLAGLWGRRGDGLQRSLRLSNANEQRRARAVDASEILAIDAGRQSVRTVVFEKGDDACRDGLALALARGAITAATHQSAMSVLANDPPAAFPFQGKDVVALGVAPGPRVGAVLSAFRTIWAAEDFPGPERAQELLQSVIDRQSDDGVAGK